MSSSYIKAGQILQIHIFSVEFRYLFSNTRTFLSNFVATDVYALLLNPCRESFFLAGSLFSFPCLSQNLSGTPDIRYVGNNQLSGLLNTLSKCPEDIETCALPLTG